MYSRLQFFSLLSIKYLSRRLSSRIAKTTTKNYPKKYYQFRDGKKCGTFLKKKNMVENKVKIGSF